MKNCLFLKNRFNIPCIAFKTAINSVYINYLFYVFNLLIFFPIMSMLCRRPMNINSYNLYFNCARHINFPA